MGASRMSFRFSLKRSDFRPTAATAGLTRSLTMKAWDLYYEEAKRHVEVQDATHRDLETKAMRLTAGCVAITGLVVSFLTAKETAAGPLLFIIPASVSGVTVIASAVLTMLVLRPRCFLLSPDLDCFARFIEENPDVEVDHPHYWTKWVGTKGIWDSYKRNEKTLNGKWAMVKGSACVSLLNLLSGLFLTGYGLLK